MGNDLIIDIKSMEVIQNIPRHVAIIPDGNRRWAKERGHSPWQGHEEGAKNTEAIIEEARNIGITELSFWGSSMENLVKRPAREKLELFRIYENHFRSLLDAEEIFRHRVKVRCIGRWKGRFPASLEALLMKIEEETKHHDASALNFFLAYSGKDDMVQAFQKASELNLPTQEVNEAWIKSALMTSELPAVDFLIRTGGGAHLSSGFLMWDIADAQLFFSEKWYPDFGKESFRKAIVEYSKRERRFGK